MTAFERFLDALDAEWPGDLPPRLTFRVLGSTALFLQTWFVDRWPGVARGARLRDPPKRRLTVSDSGTSSLARPNMDVL